jgi:hypothetical protein
MSSKVKNPSARGAR